MRILSLITFILNIVAILVLCAGMFVSFKKPKNKANFGYVLVGSVLLYMVSLFVLIIFSLFFNPNMGIVFLCVSFVSPFVIGRLVEHKTLKKYTIIQILCFALGLFPLIVYTIW